MDKKHDRERPQGEISGVKKAWAAPTWAYVGDVEDVIQQGEGKISLTQTDPGEPKKTSSTPQ